MRMYYRIQHVQLSQSYIWHGMFLGSCLTQHVLNISCAFLAGIGTLTFSCGSYVVVLNLAEYYFRMFDVQLWKKNVLSSSNLLILAPINCADTLILREGFSMF